MADYLPAGDAEFNLWQGNLVSFTEPQLVPWGIPASDFTTLKTVQGIWIEGFAQAKVKTNRDAGDVQAKNDARKLYQQSLRTFVKQWLAFNTRVSDRDRELMGVTVRKGTRTPRPKPATAPLGKIDFSKRLQHSVYFVDQATPTRRGKPVGIYGCEVWIKIDGAAPVEHSELTYIATSTRTPCVVTIEGKYAGKTAFYWLRWVNTCGETGPWSSTVSATVAG